MCEEDLGVEDSKRVHITYIDQCIMNPINFPIFEREITDISSNADIQQCLLRNSTFSGHAVKLDLTGARVSIYNTLVSIVNTIQCTILPLVSGYNAKTNKYKRWHSQPDDHYSPQRMLVMKLIQTEKPLLRKICEFQREIVNE